jgi:hypothetical protein
MTPRPDSRTDRAHRSEHHERPADPVEASRTPLVDDVPPDLDEDPKHRFSHQAQTADPNSDSDPYADAETRGADEEG